MSVRCWKCKTEFEPSPELIKEWAESGRPFEPTDWECGKCDCEDGLTPSQRKMTQRLADMVWETPETITKWLTSLGCKETYRGEHSIAFHNPYLNIFTVIDETDDPNTRAVALAFLTAGVWWTQVYPDLQGRVNREWGRRTATEKVKQ